MKAAYVSAAIMLSAIAATQASAAEAQSLFWPHAHEIAVARSAAPEAVSAGASYWVLTPEGYQRVREGENGFNCLVLRQWSAIFDQQRDLFEWDGLVAPICYDARASQAPMREQFLRAELGLAGRTHDEIKAAVFAAYAEGRLPMLNGVAFAYMYSSEQRLTPDAGHWHPHLMVYAPHYTNEMLGGNSFESADPVAFEAPGTFRTIIAIAVDARDGHIQAHH